MTVIGKTRNSDFQSIIKKLMAELIRNYNLSFEK